MELAVICDELTALGWRLAGARVEMPPPDDLEAAWRACLAHAGLVLITAGLAARLPPGALSAAQSASRPLVLVIPDLRREHTPEDPALAAERALGVNLGVKL
jgi:vacuolar-type H+-ATPase subunit F/Vma7